MDADVEDEVVRGMVADLRPDWTVRDIERPDEGTDFVGILDVETPEGPGTAVLKATTAWTVSPGIARMEPRLLRLVGEETSIPVPEVYAFRDEHPEYPAPYFLLAHVDGENLESDPGALSPAAMRRVVETAGRHLAHLHELGPLPAAGQLGVLDDEVAVLDTDEHPSYDDFREKLLADVEETLDALLDGGFFPDMAAEPERFADLVPAAREHLRETIPGQSEPAPPTYCHWDYRYGNLLVDGTSGEVRAVLDWGNLSATDPAYNLAKVEAHLLPGGPTIHPSEGGEGADLQARFRRAYAAAREDWTFDDAVRERMRCYRLVARLDAMACLPLWHQDKGPDGRDEVEAAHRSFLDEYWLG